jgi:hypothetical protein
VPKQPPGIWGIRGIFRWAREGGPSSMPLPRSAWMRLGGADRRFTVGVANLSDQRASRLAKRNRNRQGPINNVPFPRARTLWDRIGEMRRLYLGRLRGLEFGVPAGRPTMRTQAQKRLRRGAAVRTAPRQRADTPQVARPPTPAEHAQPHVGPPAEDPCRPVHHPPRTVEHEAHTRPGLGVGWARGNGLRSKDGRCRCRPPGSDGPRLAGPLDRPGNSGRQRASQAGGPV